MLSSLHRSGRMREITKVAKLVDALASGVSAREGLGVRVSSWVLLQSRILNVYKVYIL